MVARPTPSPEEAPVLVVVGLLGGVVVGGRGGAVRGVVVIVARGGGAGLDVVVFVGVGPASGAVGRVLGGFVEVGRVVGDFELALRWDGGLFEKLVYARHDRLLAGRCWVMDCRGTSEFEGNCMRLESFAIGKDGVKRNLEVLERHRIAELKVSTLTPLE